MPPGRNFLCGGIGNRQLSDSKKVIVFQDSALTILLVDDEPFILNATASLLRSAGHVVHTCEQWTGVAATVHNENPDIILMDYNMPSIKGDDLCRILKRNMGASEARIVIFSSETESDLIDIVSRSGADGYIRKNVAGHILLQAVKDVLADDKPVYVS